MISHIKDISKVKYSASVMCLDLGNLEREFKSLESVGIDELHFDIMDGSFVPNITLGFDFIKLAKQVTKLPCWAHLMIEKPSRYLKRLADLKCDGIFIHLESCLHSHRILNQIHELGMKSGVAVNPMTPLIELEYLLDSVSRVLIMGVEPGYAGQKILPQTFERVQILSRKIEHEGGAVKIEVDGNINVVNGAKLIRMGADILVLGSSSIFFGFPRNYEESFPQFKEELKKQVNLV
ncbi:MAG: ribulose-phosphate 3-epimerase [Candidatus Hydrogenedentes bacterium]|nr:ribulose-phosphate 3-epimerase [Candidatus Hydrogenedentota bacterium]